MKRLSGIALLALALPAGAGPGPGTPAPPAALANVPVYLAVDLGSHQVLAQRESDREFLPASMTKVMTAYVAFELIAQGKLKPEQVLTVTPATAATWSGRGTGMHLRAGERVPVDMLLHGITTVSANDACVVLAEGVGGSVDHWLALMNAEARKLGMTHSHFATANGWPDGGRTRVSAADLIKLGQALIERHSQLYHRYFGKKALTWNGVTQANHDPTVGVVPGADGIKTGHTRESGYSFLGTAVRDENGSPRRVMIVVGGARSEAERAEAARVLLEWSFSAWEDKPMFYKDMIVSTVVVQNGEAREVPLVAPYGINLTVPRGMHPRAAVTLRYRGPLMAPIAKGAEVAQLEIAVPGQVPTLIPLVAARSVAKAGPFDRLANGLAGLLP